MKYDFDEGFYPNIKFGFFRSDMGPDVEISMDPSAVPPDQEYIINEGKDGNCKVFTTQKLTPENVKKILAEINGFGVDEIEIYENGNFVPF